MHKYEFDDLCLRYLAGELPAADAERFNAHRADCPDCAELMRDLAAGTKAAAYAAVELSGEAQERIEQAALSAPPPAILSPLRIWAAALAALLMIGLYVGGSRQSAQHDLVWTNGLEKDIRRLGGDLDALENSFELGGAGDEIGFELRRLERESRWIQGEIKGG